MTAFAKQIFWEDVATGRRLPVDPAASFKPSSLGDRVVLRVQLGDTMGLSGGVWMRLTDPAGRGVVVPGVMRAGEDFVVDVYPPARFPNDKGFPPGLLAAGGKYRFAVAAVGLDGRTQIESPTESVLQIEPDGTGPSVEPPPVVLPPPLLSVGACCDLWALAANGCALAKGLYAIGVRRFRCFGSGFGPGGVYYGAGDWSLVRAIGVACPGAAVVLRIGVGEEQVDAKGVVIRRALPLSEDQRKVGWAHVASARAAADVDPRVGCVELDNETNWSHYLYFGQAINAVSNDVVAYDRASARIARQSLGRDAVIYTSTVGYNASPVPHVEYARRKLDSGIMDDCDVFADHAYPDGGAAMLDDHLGGVRDVIGPATPYELTETAQKSQPKPDSAARLAPVYARHDAAPDWFRGHADPARPRWSDPYSLLTADGRRNDPVCDGLDLKAVNA